MLQLKQFKAPNIDKQESCAIAKTTARCALYIAALKILESP